jgi:phosphoribosylformylglycinamidine synthase I
MKPHALILFVTGTNRDQDVAAALELAGAQPEIVHINQLNSGERRWEAYQMLVIPGGFSYADALGAGKLLALDLMQYFHEEVSTFVASGKPVIGICNGFQALVKSGILPDANHSASPRATLTFNHSGHFECRWVTLQPISEVCVWTRGLQERIECPVAHGEGNFLPASEAELDSLQQGGQIALVYVRPDGKPAGGRYPFNPNGSTIDIAGICNPNGNVLGLMPHPENHIYPFQHPHWTRAAVQGTGLPLFINGVQYASNL